MTFWFSVMAKLSDMRAEEAGILDQTKADLGLVLYALSRSRFAEHQSLTSVAHH